jgi:hypothetical protein
MKQVIYSEHHRGIVEYPLMEKPQTVGMFDSDDAELISAAYDGWNKWLSSPPIAQVPKEFIEFFSVPRGESEYELQHQICWPPNKWEGCSIGWYRHAKEEHRRIVAIPIEADVASHSVYGNNSIEQDFKELNKYLDDLSTQTTKDAGHLWTAFSDKFRVFQKRVIKSHKSQEDLYQWVLQQLIDAELEYKKQTETDLIRMMYGVICAFKDVKEKLTQSLLNSDMNVQVSDNKTIS